MELQRIAEAIVTKIADYTNSLNHPFVIKYFVKGKFFGYHASTWCQITQDIYLAKRYGGDPQKQIAIISKNLKSAIRDKRKDWEDVIFEDVFIDFKYLNNPPEQIYGVTKV